MNLKKKLSRIIGPLCSLIIISLWIWSVGQAAPLPGTLSAQTVSLPTTISNSSDEATRPTIVVDSNSTLYVAWEQGLLINKDIFYRKLSNSGASLIAPTAVYTSSDDNLLRPVMAVEASDGIQVTWDAWPLLTTKHLAYQKRLTGTTVMTISPVITDTPSAHDIVVSDNTIHTVLQGKQSNNIDFNILYSAKGLNATLWPQATPVYSSSSSPGSQSPSLVADSQGNLHLTWQEHSGATNGVIYYNKGITGSGVISWMTATPVPTFSVVMTDAARPSIAIDDNDILHLVWTDHISRDEQYIYHVLATGSVTQVTPTAWATPTRIMTQAVGVNDASPTYVLPVVAVFSNTIYVAWHDFTNDSGSLEDIYYTFSSDGGTTWATPVNVSNSDNVQSLHPQIAVDGQGTAHFVWQEKVSGKWEVRYARTQTGGVFLPIVIKN